MIVGKDFNDFAFHELDIDSLHSVVPKNPNYKNMTSSGMEEFGFI